MRIVVKAQGKERGSVPQGNLKGALHHPYMSESVIILQSLLVSWGCFVKSEVTVKWFQSEFGDFHPALRTALNVLKIIPLIMSFWVNILKQKHNHRFVATTNWLCS